MPVMSRSEYEEVEKENIENFMRESYKYMDRVVDELLTKFNEKLKNGFIRFPYRISDFDVHCSCPIFTHKQQNEALYNVQQALIAKGWDARYGTGCFRSEIVVFRDHNF